MPLSLTEALEQAVAGASATVAPEPAAVLAELDAIARRAVEEPLPALAANLEPGEVPLLGTGSTAAAYPALLWNGEWFERLGTGWPTRLAFLAQTTAAARALDGITVVAVRAGMAMRELWPPPAPEPPAAALTTDVVPAALCAAIAAGHAPAELDPIVELAAGLMVVAPATPEAALCHLHAGHSLAAGWLAVHLHRCGVIGAPGTAAEVLLTRGAP